jgi:hypothetical protein
MRKQAMAAQFTEVTLEDMDKFLKRGWRALRPKQGTDRGELYYDLHLSDHVVIRVWTSIRARQETGAGVGEDAIRIQFLSKTLKRPIMKGKAPIVKRTQGWRNNLQDRIEDYIQAYEEKDDYWDSLASGGRARAEATPPPQEEERDREREEVEQEQRDQGELRQERERYTPPPVAPSRGGPLKATYSKYRGDWCLRILGSAAPGDRVIATRASGQSQAFTIETVLWKGQDRDTGQTITLAAIPRSRNASGEAEEDYGSYERV